MNKYTKKYFARTKTDNSEKGAALIIALMVLILLAGFVAVAISRTSSDTRLVENGVSESSTYAASQASLENTTRNFVSLFETSISPKQAEIDAVKQEFPAGFDDYNFQTKIEKVGVSKNVILTGGSLGGLSSVRDSWLIGATAVQKYSETTVTIERRFFQDRVPIFQFGAFFDDDLEINRPPLFVFGGRVHTNKNLWIQSGTVPITFYSKVSVVGEIVNDMWKNHFPADANTTGARFADQTGTLQTLVPNTGSVACQNPSGPNVFSNDPNLPACSARAAWQTEKLTFQGNLENHTPKLNLPLSATSNNLREIVETSKNLGDMTANNGIPVVVSNANKDNDVQMREKFANKPGIRISLADSQNKLPGCASVAAGTKCGIQLDKQTGTSYGYQPLTMADGYKATALNGTRFNLNGRGVWIKIETVNITLNDAQPVTKDITEDILSLGLTEHAPVSGNFQINNYSSTTDSRSVVKLQRFSIPRANFQQAINENYVSSFTIDGIPQGLVVRYADVDQDPSSGCLTDTTIPRCTPKNPFAKPYPDVSAGTGAQQSFEDNQHLKWADINGSGFKYAIVAFPIETFNTREGIEKDDITSLLTMFEETKVPAAGVMSLVDLDIANLKRFLDGEFDGSFPTATSFVAANGHSLTSADIPNKNGRVIYISDRRGDADFDGEYDMEDIFQDGLLTFNEDVNHDNHLEIDFLNEAPRYDVGIPKGQAATADHKYYRRGVRLINGSTLPGRFNSASTSNTEGLTVASENGVYVLGNYNSTGAAVSGGNLTPPENYYPHNSSTDVPAAIVADAVTILSNRWTDGAVFNQPFRKASRRGEDTVVRFAMISGMSISGVNGNPIDPSAIGMYSGGIHNFKRFLEDWSGYRLNYSGSLINLFNSANENGFFKCCTTVYNPPYRDWVFDTNFLNPDRLPPGTPYIYSITFTGFERKLPN
ncbi:MAG: hypothetical protein ACK5NT_04790 [Pyrinomonadaceae bacterium]